MTDFLRDRGLLRSAQRIMALVASLSTLVPLSHLLINRHMSLLALFVAVMSVAFTVGMTLFWWNRWPSRWMSELVALAGAAFVLLWSYVQVSPGVAALACAALAVTGGYLAFFHSARALLINLLFAIAGGVMVAGRLTEEFGIATAVSAFWIIWFVNTSVPVAVRGMSQAMGAYAVQAFRDALTGLLNRRAFDEAAGRMLTQSPRGAAELAVLMVDIDNFKRINDTFGHAAGDRLIIAVAEVLSRHTPDGSAICRAGGEEFLIAVTPPAAAEPTARRICAAIAGLPDGVTASIGVAGSVTALPVSGTAETVPHLIAGADAAMYIAKRSGGNTVRLA